MYKMTESLLFVDFFQQPTYFKLVLHLIQLNTFKRRRDQVPLKVRDEVRIAIRRLKNNKKSGGEMLVEDMHQILCKYDLTLGTKV